ncbi:MAG: PorT family protein [Candidatus Treponema excrementipullorum]|uniref:PorT family protein n=1 Tax=Candidatus Treponema excrementipullorum TaxID=2838768 RepID=A0A9E2L1I4_9SPIR|nr:PorT family protein [Candidatus Treponema excrementipullorum]
MKKIVLVLTTALLFVSLASAQITIGAKGIFTLNAGTKEAEDFQNLKNDISTVVELVGASFDSQLVVGGGGGLFVRYNMPFLSSLGIQTGLDVLANNGYKVEAAKTISEKTYSASISATYTSLELPILVTYDIGLGPVTLTLLLGPNISFPINKMKITTSSSIITDRSGTNEWNIANKAIFGITGGAAVALRLGPGSLVTDIRYINDFTPVKAGEKDSENPMDLFTRRALALSLGYQIRL